MSNNLVYQEYKKFKREHPKTIVWRARKHARVINDHINTTETLKYVFGGQKNRGSFNFMNSCLVAVTTKRILIATKRVVWGYFFTSITPDLYNDLKVTKNLIWSDIEIDTVKENVYISNIDPSAGIEIETIITNLMMKEKRKYAKKY